MVCRRGFVLLALLMVFFIPGLLYAGGHTWRVNEVFSNADGTIQFVELKECCGLPNEVNTNGKRVQSTATGSQFTLPQNQTPGTTANLHILLGTAAFAATPGAPTPDYILNDNFIGLSGDTINLFPNGAADITFGLGDLPTDGVNSLHDAGAGFSVLPNSPTNQAGISGSITINAMDVCAGAMVVGEASGIAVDTVTATLDATPASCGSPAPDVWLSYNASCSGTATAETTSGPNNDTILEVWEGCGGVLLGCNDHIDAGAANFLSRVEWAVTAGSSYFIRGSGAIGATGSITLDITCLENPDLDGDGIPNECDIDQTMGEDCDSNGALDSCDIAGGAPDSDQDGVQDACDPDIDGDGILNGCDIDQTAGTDCNGNGTLDSCDLANGGADANGDGILDECEEVLFVRAEVNGDGALDISDALSVLQVLFNQQSTTCLSAADTNGSGTVDVGDVIFLLNYLFVSAVQPPAPFPNCGIDPAPSALGCDSYSGC